MSTYTKAEIKAQGIFLKALNSDEYTQLKDENCLALGDEKECSFCLIGAAKNELALTKGIAYGDVGYFATTKWLGGSLNRIILDNGRNAVRCNDETDMTFKQIAKQLKAYWLRKR